jgi:hypothetical protein
VCSCAFVVRRKPSGFVVVIKLSICKRWQQVIQLLGLLPVAIAIVSMLVALLPLLCLGLLTMVCKQCNHWYRHCKALVIASFLVVSLLLSQGDMIVCVIIVGCQMLLSGIKLSNRQILLDLTER